MRAAFASTSRLACCPSSAAAAPLATLARTVVLPARRPYSAQRTAPNGYGLGPSGGGDGRVASFSRRSTLPPLTPSAPELDVVLPPPTALPPLATVREQQAHEAQRKLSQAAHKRRVWLERANVTPELLAQLVEHAEKHERGGKVKNEELPPKLVVRPRLPPDNKIAPPTTVGELAARPEVASALEQGTHDLVLVKTGSILTAHDAAGADEADIKSWCIAALVERAAPAPKTPQSKVKVETAARLLGKQSNLRADGVPQEVFISWVSSSNDVAHRMAAVRELLTTAFRARVTFQPKRKGGRRDPVPPPPTQREMLDEVVEKLKDVAVRCEDDRFDKGKSSASVTLEPLPAVRTAYRKQAEAADASATAVKMAAAERLAAKKRRDEERQQEAERLKEAQRAFLRNL